jgi:hypothetical protein
VTAPDALVRTWPGRRFVDDPDVLGDPARLLAALGTGTAPTRRSPG